MKKITKVVATTLMALAFSACDSHAHKDLDPETSGSYSPLTNVTLGCFELTEANISLKEGEKHELNYMSLPVLAEMPEITYSSSNSNVVSVSKEGLLTAKNSGFAKITANCAGFSKECYVSVTPDNTKDKSLENIKAAKTLQASPTFERPTYLRTFSAIQETLVKDGQVRNQTVDAETLTLSLDDAYIYIEDTYYGTTKIEQSPMTYSLARWVIYCTEEFETFIFHESQGVRRYIKVDCSKYAETENRWLGVKAVLDSLFTNGADQFTDDIDDVAGNPTNPDSDELTNVIDYYEKGYSNVINVTGRGDDDGNFWTTYTVVFEDDLMGFGMIAPSGVYADIDMKIEEYYNAGYMKYFFRNQVCTYDWRGSHYELTSNKQSSYDIEPKDLYYPNIKAEGWTEGEDIYDI